MTTQTGAGLAYSATRRQASRYRRFMGNLELVVHLAGRQLRATHRRSVLGWSWPLLLQIAQLAVLAFLFGRVIRLEIEHFATFVFAGLVFWNWFSSGVLSATGSVVDGRSLVLEPRMPRAALPLVAIAVAAFDALVALPVLLVMVAFTVGLSPALAFLPVIVAMQVILMVGLGLLMSALNVYVRDVKQLMTVGLLILFYVTPIFYTIELVPPEYESFFEWSPLAAMITSYQAVFIYGELPDAHALAVLGAACLVVIAVGVPVFRRLSRAFVDEL